MLFSSACRRRATGIIMGAVLAGSLAVALPVVTTAPKAAAATEACQKATLHAAVAANLMIITCVAAADELGLNPVADLACVAAAYYYSVAVQLQQQACDQSNSPLISDNVSADPGVLDNALADAGDTSPQPGDVVETTATYDGTDGSGDYTYTLDITGWEDQAQWGGGGTPGCGASATVSLEC